METVNGRAQDSILRHQQDRRKVSLDLTDNWDKALVFHDRINNREDKVSLQTLARDSVKVSNHNLNNSNSPAEDGDLSLEALLPSLVFSPDSVEGRAAPTETWTTELLRYQLLLEACSVMKTEIGTTLRLESPSQTQSLSPSGS